MPFGLLRYEDRQSSVVSGQWWTIAGFSCSMLFDAADQRAQHLADADRDLSTGSSSFHIHHIQPGCKEQVGFEFSNRALRDPEKIQEVARLVPSVSLRNVGGNRNGGSADLHRQAIGLFTGE